MDKLKIHFLNTITNQMSTTKFASIASAEKITFPVLVRPSYVIGGRGMQVVYNKDELVFVSILHQDTTL